MKSFVLGIAAGALLAAPALAGSGKNSRHESIVQVNEISPNSEALVDLQQRQRR